MDKQVRFSQVCTLLEKVTKARTVLSKKNLIQRYLNNWRRSDPDCYPLLRLLLPHLDERSRGGSYGLKEAKLADVYISALSLSKTSHDSYSLRKFEQHG